MEKSVLSISFSPVSFEDTEYNSMSTRLGFYYTKRLGNCVHFTLVHIYIFHVVLLFIFCLPMVM